MWLQTPVTPPFTEWPHSSALQHPHYYPSLSRRLITNCIDFSLTLSQAMLEEMYMG